MFRFRQRIGPIALRLTGQNLVPAVIADCVEARLQPRPEQRIR